MEADKEQIKFLALGDSYTIGEAVAANERWPDQLVRLLRMSNVSIASPEIIATTGWTTDELLKAVKEADPQPCYGLVSLLIGVNNQYRGYALDVFKKEFTELLKAAIYFACGKPERVIVLSIPDYGVTPFAQDKNPQKIAYEIDVYNEICETISAAYQANFFNITSISRAAATNPELTAEDLLHPAGKMYGRWVEKIFSDVLNLFKRN